VGTEPCCADDSSRTRRVGDLVTNAALYGAGDVRLDFHVDTDEVFVAVLDGGFSFDWQPRHAEPPVS